MNDHCDSPLEAITSTGPGALGKSVLCWERAVYCAPGTNTCRQIYVASWKKLYVRLHIWVHICEAAYMGTICIFGYSRRQGVNMVL